MSCIWLDVHVDKGSVNKFMKLTFLLIQCFQFLESKGIVEGGK